VAAVGLNAVVALSVLGPFLRERLHTSAYAVRAVAAAMAVGYEAIIDVAAGELVLPEFAHGVCFFFSLFSFGLDLEEMMCVLAFCCCAF
jgi:hypothetical protein